MFYLMRRIGFIFCFVLVAFTGLQGQVRFAEFEGVEWWTHVGGHAYQYVDFIEVDDSGNVYVAGRFDRELYLRNRDGVDLDYFPDYQCALEADFHVFFVKYDSGGEFQWVNWLEKTDQNLLNLTSFTYSDAGYATALVRLNDTVTTRDGAIFFPKSGTGVDDIVLKLFPNGSIEEVARVWGAGFVKVTGLIPLANEEYLATVSHGQGGFNIGGEEVRFDSIVFDSGTFHTSLIHINSQNLILQHRLIKALAGISTAIKIVDNGIRGAVVLMGMSSNNGNSEGIATCDGDTVIAKGYITMRFDRELNLSFISKPMPFENTRIDLACDIKGNLFVSCTKPGGDSIYSVLNSFVTKLSQFGDTLWDIHTNGIQVYSGGIDVSSDALFWTGSYGIKMELGSLFFERLSAGSTGFVAKIDLLTGTLNWVITDTISRHSKELGGIAVACDDQIHFTANFDQNYSLFGQDTVWVYPFTGFNDVAIVTIKDPEPAKQNPEPEYPQWFTVFPNPSHGEFSFGLNQNFPAQSFFEIRDLRGRLIGQTIVAENGSQKIDFSEKLSVGVYLVILKNRSGNILQTKKIIIHLE